MPAASFSCLEAACSWPSSWPVAWASWNLLRYAHSWDLVKFGTVAAFALSIATSATGPRGSSLFDQPRWALPWACCCSWASRPMAWRSRSSLLLMSREFPWPCIPEEPLRPPASADLQAIAWLRGRVSADEIVYRKLSAAIAYDHVGGLAVPWYDGLTDTFGFSRQRMERRRRLLVEPPPDPDVYDSERIRWFVLGPARLSALSIR